MIGDGYARFWRAAGPGLGDSTPEACVPVLREKTDERFGQVSNVTGPPCRSAQPGVGPQDSKQARRCCLQELIDNLGHKNKGIQNDRIKTLYEIGSANPDLVAKYYKEFGKLLESKNHRLVWGGKGWHDRAG